MLNKKQTCRICGSEETFHFMKGIYDCSSTKVIECKKCEVRFLDPIMSIDEETEYYKNYYKSQEDRYVVKSTLEDIQNSSYKFHKSYLNHYTKYINSTSSVLEIGSGTGGVIKLLSKDLLVNNITSVEKSQSNIDFLKSSFDKNINFHYDISEVNNNKYDVIISHALFEHLREPKIFLLEMKSMLNTNGYLIMEMPNKHEPLIELLGIEEFKKFTYQKQHYFIYNEKSLTFLANNTNLKVETFYYCQRYSIDNHMSWAINKKPKDFSMFSNLFSEKTKNEYRNDLIKNKTTDTIGVVLSIA